MINNVEHKCKQRLMGHYVQIIKKRKKKKRKCKSPIAYVSVIDLISLSLFDSDGESDINSITLPTTGSFKASH